MKENMYTDHSNAISYLCDNDLIMNEIIHKVGECTLKPDNNYFTNLVRSIISQQLSLHAAKSIWIRFLTHFGNNIDPNNILVVENISFKAIGLSAQKTRYIKEVANYFKNHPDLPIILPMLTNEEIISLLTSIKGVGIWTAQMFLIFSLCRPNVLPVSDSGLRRSIIIHYRINRESSIEEIQLIANKWGEFSSIASWYLWRALEVD